MPLARPLFLRLLAVSSMCAVGGTLLQSLCAAAEPRPDPVAVCAWLVAAAAVSAAALALAAPVGRALRLGAGDAPSFTVREDGARAARRLPARLSALALGAGAVVAAVTGWGAAARGAEPVLPALAAAAAVALAWAVSVYAVASGPAGQALAALGEVPAGPTGQLRRRVVALGIGLLASALLVQAALVTAVPREAVSRGGGAPPRADQVSLIVLSVLVVWAALFFLAARAVTAGLPGVLRVTEAMAAGDLTARGAVASSDELGRAAEDLRMAASAFAAVVAEARSAAAVGHEGSAQAVRVGERVRSAARRQRTLAAGAVEAVRAVQVAAERFQRGAAGIGDHVHATSAAVGSMAAALEEARRQSAELDRQMTAAGSDVGALSQATRSARAQLGALGVLAGQAGSTVDALASSLSALESSASENHLAASQASEVADRAGGIVQETVRGVESVRSLVSDARSRVTALGRRSDDIDKILDFIAEVAGRTNLLSLNASIIATQAGEHGKAFAVVAEQIRELAAQISSSTKSIGQIIRALRSDVSGTARLIERGDEMAGEGLAQAQRSVAALAEISGAASAGRTAAGQILSAVQTHAVSTREVSELARSVAGSSQSLSDAIHLVGTSADALQAVADGVRTLADGLGRALEEQSGVGHQQVESLELLDGILADATRAVEEHGAAAGRLAETLAGLALSADEQEGAAAELAGAADRMGARAGALADRVDRFKIQ